MKRRKSTRRRAVSRRRAVANPSYRRRRRRHAVSNPVSYRRHRRRVHRNPSFSGKGILGEFASKDGLMMLGAAAIAPTAVNFIADKIVPTQYNSGWTGLAAKTVIAGGITWALDRYLKQRKAALGFAIGSLGSLIAQAVQTYRVGSALPQAPAPVADEIARNPALFEQVMSGDYSALNGYEMAPVGGYDVTPLSGMPGSPDPNGFDSLN